MDDSIPKDTWKTRMIRELNQAELAREAGNEGRSRVCARRAAGIIAGEYLSRHGQNSLTFSAYDLLRRLLADPYLPLETREIVAHFILKVNEDHRLPEEIDLIIEAQRLANSLFSESL
jgi:hypothetical protein